MARQGMGYIRRLVSEQHTTLAALEEQRVYLDQLGDHDYGAHHLLIVYDHENVRLNNVNAQEYFTRLQEAYRHQFPGIHMSVITAANPQQITLAESLACEALGEVVYINEQHHPVTGTRLEGVADRRLVLEIYRHAHAHHAPGVVVLVSSDSDFCCAMKSVRNMGYLTSVITNGNPCGRHLESAVNNVYNWSDISVNNPGSFDALRAPRLRFMVPRQLLNNKTFILWDTDSRRPRNLDILHAFASLNVHVTPHLRVGNPPIEPHATTVYGGNIRRQDIVDGMMYLKTNSQKRTNLENNILTDVLEFACTHADSNTVVLVSNNIVFADAIRWIREQQFQVILVGGEHQVLTDGAQISLDVPPNWQMQM